MYRFVFLGDDRPDVREAGRTSKEGAPSFTSEDLRDVNALLKRLSAGSPTLSTDDIRRVAADDRLHVVFCRQVETGRIVGMARMVTVPMLVGSEGIVEDVVVDDGHGGRGIGVALMNELIRRAQERGVRRLALTTWPDREPAMRLYRSLGFEQLDVVYFRKNIQNA
jgi:ribosomal protein S18 acetylase RimI-like enzyme